MLRITAAVLLLSALGLAQGDKCSVDFAYGKYTGSCVQLAASVPDGSSSYCVAKGDIVTYPFDVLWTKAKSLYKYDQAGVNITTLGDHVYGYAAYSSAVGTAELSFMPKSKAYCTVVNFADGSKAKFRAYTVQEGKTMTYVEEGVYSTATNTAMDDVCPTEDNPKLYCNDHTYNYRCVAYAVCA